MDNDNGEIDKECNGTLSLQTSRNEKLSRFKFQILKTMTLDIHVQLVQYYVGRDKCKCNGNGKARITGSTDHQVSTSTFTYISNYRGPFKDPPAIESSF